jgi:NADPH:quinone reductase-like Zn-dependent oxidoreductase
MKAMVREKYGSPKVVELRNVETPTPEEDEVLVRVRAAALNRLDWYDLTGTPLLVRPMMGGVIAPKSELFGADYAGTVEAVGPGVTDLKPGDEVYGSSGGSFAQYLTVKNGVGTKPANLTFEEAAAAPVAGVTAMQGIRDHGRLEAGERVLVNGASGGVGTFAVQIAKALGGQVTAVCSTKHVDAIRSLGADAVVDYTQSDFTRSGRRYDLVADVAGSSSWRRLRRMVAPGGRVVVIGGPSGKLLGPLPHIASFKLGGMRSRVPTSFFVAKVNRESLGDLRELIEAGKVRPVVDRRFELEELPEALRLMGEGHVQGKLVVSVP